MNFAWSCTLADLGEYVFTRRRGRRRGDDELALRHLGQRAVRSERRAQRRHVEPRQHHGPGAGRDASPAATRPGSTASGAATRPPSGSTASTTAPGRRARTPWARSSKGGALTTDGAGTIYALRGDGTQAFWAHDVATNTWTAKANTGTNVDGGRRARLPEPQRAEYVYATMGGSTAFKRYNVAHRHLERAGERAERTSRRAARSPRTARTSTSCAATATRSSTATTSPPTPGRRWRPCRSTSAGAAA